MTPEEKELYKANDFEMQMFSGKSTGGRPGSLLPKEKGVKITVKHVKAPEEVKEESLSKDAAAE